MIFYLIQDVEIRNQITHLNFFNFQFHCQDKKINSQVKGERLFFIQHFTVKSYCHGIWCYRAAYILLCSRSARRQKVSSLALISWGKGEPSLSIARNGRSSISCKISFSFASSGSAASFFELVISSLNKASDRRLGMQPNGPMAITPQTCDAISARELPTVKIASPARSGEMNPAA